MGDNQIEFPALFTVARRAITLNTLAALLEAITDFRRGAARAGAGPISTSVDSPIAEGYGARRLAGFRPRCRACGALGQIQVRPPTPSWGGANWGPIRTPVPPPS